MSKSPYVGLRPFQRDEANIFFGRSQHTDDLLEQLAQHHFLTVVGDSGSGKTSVIHAGLIPRLLEGTFALPDTHWHIAEMVPGNQPFANLTAALLAEGALGKNPSSAALDTDALKRSPNSLHDWLIEHPLGMNAKLLIICDQFEDIHRYPNPENAAFIKLLLASSQRHADSSGVQSHPIYVLVALRTDYLDDNNAYPPLAAAMHKGIYHLPDLDHEQLKTAIEQPAAMFGGEIEAELVSQLLTDAVLFPDPLPLLQHALMSLWTRSADKKLTIFDYFVLGGLKRIISNHAEQSYLSLTTEQQQIAAVLFKSLVENGTKHHALALPIKLSEVAALAKVNWQGVATVVDTFRKESQGFLLPPQPTTLLPNTLLDIAHDSFIRQWQRLNGWIEEETQSAENYARLLDYTNTYQTPPETLLRSPELQLLWQWYKETKPTAVWAKRYGGDFDSAIAFLQKSHKASKYKKTVQLAGGIAVTAFFVAVGNAIYFAEDKPAVTVAQQVTAQAPTKPFNAKPLKVAKPKISAAKVTEQAPPVQPTTVPTSSPETLNVAKIEAERLKIEQLEAAKLEADALKAKKLETAKLEAEKLKAEQPKTAKLEAKKSEPLTQTTIDNQTWRDLSKRFPDKLQLMREYKNSNVNDPVLWHKLADQLRRQSEQERQPQKSDAAIEAFQKTVELDANDYKAWFSIGDIYRIRTEAHADSAQRSSHQGQAIAAFSKVTSLYPNSEWAFYYLGTIYQQQKKFDEAIENYKKQLSVTPKHKFAWQYLGSAYQKQNKFKDAIAAFQQALKLNPNNAEAKKQLQALEKEANQ